MKDKKKLESLVQEFLDAKKAIPEKIPQPSPPPLVTTFEVLCRWQEDVEFWVNRQKLIDQAELLVSQKIKEISRFLGDAPFNTLLIINNHKFRNSASTKIEYSWRYEGEVEKINE